MRKDMINSYVSSLALSLGENHRQVDPQILERLFKARDYSGMIKFVRDSMHLDLRVRLGIVNSGGPKTAPAWIEMNSEIAQPGTAAFRRELATVYLKRSFLNESNFAQAAIAIAHEFAHVVLNSLKHKLRHEEPAVDLTAMLLGYRDLYLQGCSTLKVERGVNWRRETTHSLGYLTKDEVEYAARRLGYVAPWWKSRFVSALQPYFLTIGFCAAPLVLIASSDRGVQHQFRKMWRYLVRDEIYVPLIILFVAGGMIAAAWIRKSRNAKKPHNPRDPTGYQEHATRPRNSSGEADTERRFKAVFAMITPARRLALVEYYRGKHGCGTHAAMQLAMDDLHNEQNRYR